MLKCDAYKTFKLRLVHFSWIWDDTMMKKAPCACAISSPPLQSWDLMLLCGDFNTPEPELTSFT